MKYRTLKLSPEGKQPRAKVREVVRGVHVIPVTQRRWMVRTIGRKSVEKEFPSMTDALAFAGTLGRQRRSKVIVHQHDTGAASVREPTSVVQN